MWKGVHLYGGADRSQINGLDVEYAGTADGAAVSLAGAVDVAFTHSSIKHARNIGLDAKDSSTFSAFTGNVFDDIAKLSMQVEPVTIRHARRRQHVQQGRVHLVLGGKVPTDATWHNAGAPYDIDGEISVQTVTTPTTLTLTDATLMFLPNAAIDVGYSSTGKIVVTGPATLSSVDSSPPAGRASWSTRAASPRSTTRR